jgi:Fe2+ or Zn2+ uptake regulation protein
MRMIRIRNEEKRVEGYVLTPQRKLILETLRRAFGTLDARELYKAVNQADKTISLATVYRSLNLFKEAGLIDEHRLGRSCCCYELKQSLEHQHALCKVCGKIIEFESPLIAEMIRQVKAEKEFAIDRVEVCLQGVCKECRENETRTVT